MLRDKPLVTEEIYHIYNRGAHKSNIFTDAGDYERFIVLLYLSNNTDSIHLSKLFVSPKYQGRSLKTAVFESEKPDQGLVDVLGYCLMKNHFHLILRQKTDGGISLFMKRLLTGYSMYFNIRYDHSGALFQGRFKSKYVDSDAYFRYLFSYVHLNPLELSEPNWKTEGISGPEKVRASLKNYPYSSYSDYFGSERPEQHILSQNAAKEILGSPSSADDLFAWFAEGEESYQGPSSGDRVG